MHSKGDVDYSFIECSSMDYPQQWVNDKSMVTFSDLLLIDIEWLLLTEHYKKLGKILQAIALRTPLNLYNPVYQEKLLSPYLFFWQTSQEAEEVVRKGQEKEINSPQKPTTSKKDVKLMRADVVVGMAFSQLIMWSIIITTSGSLHTHGVTEIGSAEEAAKALEPLVASFPFSGTIAKSIFAAGIIGTGLLAVPVLAGSSGYALADTFGWKQGLNKKFRNAKAFYLVIAAATAIGLTINMMGIHPVQALIYSAVINGIVAIPILFFLMRIANDRQVMGSKVNGKLSNVIGWLTFAIMVVAVSVLFLLWGR